MNFSILDWFHCMGHTRQKKYPFQIDCKFFLKGVAFMFWHDIVYIELLYCVTNFGLVWTWNKVAVVENAKKCRLYPTFPYLCKIASVAYTIIKQDLLLHKNTIYREWKHIWICLLQRMLVPNFGPKFLKIWSLPHLFHLKDLFFCFPLKLITCHLVGLNSQTISCILLFSAPSKCAKQQPLNKLTKR